MRNRFEKLIKNTPHVSFYKHAFDAKILNNILTEIRNIAEPEGLKNYIYQGGLMITIFYNPLVQHLLYSTKELDKSYNHKWQPQDNKSYLKYKFDSDKDLYFTLILRKYDLHWVQRNFEKSKLLKGDDRQSVGNLIEEGLIRQIMS